MAQTTSEWRSVISDNSSVNSTTQIVPLQSCSNTRGRIDTKLFLLRLLFDVTEGSIKQEHPVSWRMLHKWSIVNPFFQNFIWRFPISEEMLTWRQTFFETSVYLCSIPVILFANIELPKFFDEFYVLICYVIFEERLGRIWSRLSFLKMSFGMNRVNKFYHYYYYHYY